MPVNDETDVTENLFFSVDHQTSMLH